MALAPDSALGAGEKLVVVGGGRRPTDSNARFVKWGGGEKARILVLTWASDPAADYFDYLAADLHAYNPTSIVHGVTSGDVTANRDKLVQQINDATAIYFTGGDQNLTMDVIDADLRAVPAANSLLALLRDRYQAGVVFGGTSAGCAVMATPMLTGTADLTILDGKQVETRDGLGILPGVILDQHFMARNRTLRLMGLMQEHPTKLGLGIDESTALLITDGRYAEVVGESQVLAMQATGPHGQVLVDPLPVGTRYDIAKRARY